MSVLTYLTAAIVRDGTNELDGKTLTRPALLITDGFSTAYAVDVDIGEKEPLRNVLLARSSYDVIYADVGAAVRLRRSVSGKFEVIGYSAEMPGTNICVTIDLDDPAFEVIEDLTYTSRPLTYGEIVPYGTMPYGAVALYRGGTLLEIKA